MTKQKKEYPELVKVMTKEELDAYCKFYDDMCNPLKKYKDMFIVAEYMSSPRDEYYNVAIYKKLKNGKNEYYIRKAIIRCETDEIGYDEYDGYNVDDVYKFAYKFADLF